jgi:hypothetical protein
MLEFVWDFKNYVFNLMKLSSILWLRCFFNKINNDLFNIYVLYFINFIVKLKILVNMEKLKFLYKIDNDLRVLIK